MRVIIAGCGRVGSQLGVSLSAEGHEVTVIDKDAQAFRRLPTDFPGTTLVGIVFDRETLERAGIRHAQCFVAVTSGDNSNIVSARTAKEHYGVDRVVARIYDPLRAEIFERMNMTIVASARWTAAAITRSLSRDEEDERVDGTVGRGIGDVLLVTMRVPAATHGVDVTALQRPGAHVVAGITRGGNTAVPTVGGLLEGGDLVHLAVERTALDDARRAVALLEEEHA